MNTKFKKLVRAISLVLCVAMLAACGNGKEVAKEKDANTVTAVKTNKRQFVDHEPDNQTNQFELRI